MSAGRSLLWLLMSAAILGCATGTPREKVLRDMGLAAMLGAGLGQARAEYKNQNSALYAGVLASLVGGASLILRKQQLDQPLEEASTLKAKLQKFEAQFEPKLIAEGKSLFATPLPRELHPFVEPGAWRRYKLDQWVQDPNQPNQWFRQIEMIEILPPLTK